MERKHVYRELATLKQGTLSLTTYLEYWRESPDGSRLRRPRQFPKYVVQAAGALPNPSLRYQYLEEHCNVDPLTFIILLDHKPGTKPDGISRGITNTNTTNTNIKFWYRYLGY